MRYTFICSDTHGGVQPYVALCMELKQRGHEVCCLAPENFRHFVDSHGVPYSPLTGDFQEFLGSDEFKAVADKGFLAIQRLALRMASELMMQWMIEALHACQGSDFILTGIGGYAVAEAVAEKLGVPLIQAHLQPLSPTRTFPGALAPEWLSLFGGLGHWLGHQLTRQIMWQPIRMAVNRARKDVLGLGPASLSGNIGKPSGVTKMVLYGFSQHVLPKPADWGGEVHVTGYWFLDVASAWSPPTELLTFLESGPAPLVVGFGSMADRDAAATMQLVSDVVKATNMRAVVLSGWGGMGAKAKVDPSIFVLESAPHDWLFPRAAAVVHHGGAGTTGAALRAGTPSVIVPFAAEQPFWGRRTMQLGCGSFPIPKRHLTMKRLTDAINQVLTQPVRNKSFQMGELIRAENGVSKALIHLTA